MYRYIYININKFYRYITLICAVPGGNSAPVKVDIRELAYIEKQKN